MYSSQKNLSPDWLTGLKPPVSYVRPVGSVITSRESGRYNLDDRPVLVIRYHKCRIVSVPLIRTDPTPQWCGYVHTHCCIAPRCEKVQIDFRPKFHKLESLAHSYTRISSRNYADISNMLRYISLAHYLFLKAILLEFHIFMCMICLSISFGFISIISTLMRIRPFVALQHQNQLVSQY